MIHTYARLLVRLAHAWNVCENLHGNLMIKAERSARITFIRLDLPMLRVIMKRKILSQNPALLN